MAEQLQQQLFLLEVMVDNVVMCPRCCLECTCPNARRDTDGNVRVRVKFIDFPCLEIRQSEFGRHDRRDRFSCGKSLLFPMAPLDVVRAIHYFPLAVTVINKAKVLGVCRVALSEDMANAVRRAAHCCAAQQCAVLKGDFQLVELDGQKSGTVSLFIRLSCFGQNIVTEFNASSGLFSYSLQDNSPACPHCFSKEQPTDPRDADVRPAMALLSELEQVRGECPCHRVCRLPVVWRLRQPCECKQFPVRSFVHRITGKMAEQQALLDALEAAERAAREAEKAAGDAAAAAAAALEVVQLPRVRYDTTGALSPVAGGCVEPAVSAGWRPAQHPPVRYDTTGALSPASEWAPPPPQPLQPWPPVRYDTTGGLSPVGSLPPVRYDTTGRLSRAFQGLGLEPTPSQPAPPSQRRQKPAPRRTSPPKPLKTAPPAPTQPPPPTAQPPPPPLPPPPPPPPPPPSTKAAAETSSSPDVAALTQCIKAAPGGRKQVSKRKKKKKKKNTFATNHTVRLKQLLKKMEMLSKTARLRQKQQQARCRFQPSKFVVYSYGDAYPGIRVGHNTCVTNSRKVPGRVGWLWNTGVCSYGLKWRRGWRPGAIGRSLQGRVRSVPAASAPDQHLQRRPKRSSDQPPPGYPLPALREAPKCVQEPMTLPPEEPPPPPPATLQVHRERGGDISVTLHPLSMGAAPDRAPPLTLRIPSRRRDTAPDSSQSELNLEVFAPGSFQPVQKRPELMNTQVQYYVGDFTPRAPALPPSKKRKKEEDGDGAERDKKAAKTGNAKGGEGDKKAARDRGAGEGGVKPQTIAWDQDRQVTAVAAVKAK